MLSPSHVQAIAQRIAAAAHSPLKVIVFGSYGRGDATEDSDLDLLVVEREIPDPTAEYLRLRDVVGAVGVDVDLLLLLQAEFDRRREWSSSPVYWAAREGRAGTATTQVVSNSGMSLERSEIGDAKRVDRL